MSPGTLIPIVVRTSIALVVFSLGLQVSLGGMTYLVRRPALIARSLLSMNVVTPLIAGLLVACLNLHPAVSVALLALSVSPVPPLLPIKGLKAGGGSEFIFSLLVVEAVLAMLFIPLSMEIFGRAFGKQVHIAASTVAPVAFTTVLAPLGAGILVRPVVLSLADRIARTVSLIGVILLVASLIPVLFIAMPAVVSLIGNGTLMIMFGFIVASLATGHLLGGPEPENRIVLALSTASRHPGVAMSIASGSFLEERLALAVLLLYLIVNAVVSIPYLLWRRSHIESMR